MKILAIVTAYNPEPDLLIRSIASYIDGVDTLLIWRNSPVDEKGIASKFANGKIVFCGDGSNAGISKALNHAWRYARDGGYSHLLTMDQDSLWQGFEAFTDFVKKRGDEDCFYAPGVNDESLESGFEEAETMITSGMLVPVGMLDEIDGYREDFKVDGIDNDLFYHAKALGWKPLKVGGCALHQQFGRLQFHKFMRWRIGTLNYSAERIYSIYRNNYIVIRSYPGTEPMKKRFRKSCFWNRPIRILLAEKDRYAKFKAMFRGIRDAKRWLKENPSVTF